MLDVAVRYRLITTNPAADIELPTLNHDHIHVLTLDEARALIAAAEGRLDKRPTYTTRDGRTKKLPQVNPRYAALYVILLALGLRRGEALGLRWIDLDWNAGSVQIRRQVQVVKMKVVVSEYTKTDAGRRVLPLAPALLARLRAHEQNQQEERALRGAAWTDHELIFPSESGLPMQPTNLHRHYQGVLASAGLSDVRIHDLRHTCATLLGERTSDRVIAAILGHTPGTITAHYAKVTLAQMRVALDAHYAELTGEV
jgi:integrase